MRFAQLELSLPGMLGLMDMVSKLKKFWHSLGPGLIASAADNDASTITTTAIAGAKFGLATLWTALFTLPFMIIVQRMAGRIGLISGRGMAANMRRYYPRPVLAIVATVFVIANIINIGADMSAMGTALGLIIPISPMILGGAISGIIILVLIFLSYREVAEYLKWIAIVMFAYVISAFLVEQPWRDILRHTFIPGNLWHNKEYIKMILAILGTTVSPYIFFWQAAEAVEEERAHRNHHPSDMIPDIKPHGEYRTVEMKSEEVGAMYKDVKYGMVFSNLVTYFIILLAASTFFRHGITDITNLDDIATTLQPLAGRFANVLFMVGIIASGMLAIPVLAGSSAYVLAEAFGWKEGLDRRFGRAKEFYIIMIVSTVLGFLIPLMHLDPIDILFNTALLFGIISPVIVMLIIHMANNPKIMGSFTSRWWTNLIAYTLVIIMAASIIFTYFL